MFDPDQPVAKIYPPEEDFDDGDEVGGVPTHRGDPAWTRSREAERNLRDREGGGQTVSYRTFYGPGHYRGKGPPKLDPLGYSSGDFVHVAPNRRDDSGGIWGDESVPGRDGSRDAVFEESDLGERGSGGKKEGSTRSKSANGDRGGSSLLTAEEEKRGRDYLKNLIEEKFMTLTTPLKRFVSRYLAITGENTEDKIYEYIKVRKIFSRNVPIQDWDDLVRAVYRPGDFGGDAHVGEEGFTTEELADAIFDMVTRDRQIAKRWHAARAATIQNRAEEEARGEYETPRALEVELAVEKLKQSATLKGRTARHLMESYNHMVEGKVVFLLDNVLRESAQATLDAINERGGRLGRDAFTLLEVMRSNAPLTEFLQLMVMRKQTMRNFQSVPIRPVVGGGIYGTLADRISEGGGYRGGDYGGKTVNVFSRPTVANLVATSQETLAGSNYFFWVVRTTDSNGTSSLVHDPKARASELRSGSCRRGGCARGTTGEGGFSWSTSRNCETSRYDRCRNPREKKPVQSMRDVLDNRYLGIHVEQTRANYDPDFLSVKEFGTGAKVLVRKTILDDEEAMRKIVNNNEIPEAYRVRQNPWKYGRGQREVSRW